LKKSFWASHSVGLVFSGKIRNSKISILMHFFGANLVDLRMVPAVKKETGLYRPVSPGQSMFDSRSFRD